MKTILVASLLAAFSAHAQNSEEKPRAAQKSCDELVGQAKEACLKQGGTVKANTAAGGSSAPAPKKPAKKDYPKRDSK